MQCDVYMHCVHRHVLAVTMAREAKRNFDKIETTDL